MILYPKPRILHDQYNQLQVLQYLEEMLFVMTKKKRLLVRSKRSYQDHNQRSVEAHHHLTYPWSLTYPCQGKETFLTIKLEQNESKKNDDDKKIGIRLKSKN